jgi:hypothetical protein
MEHRDRPDCLRVGSEHSLRNLIIQAQNRSMYFLLQCSHKALQFLCSIKYTLLFIIDKTNYKSLIECVFFTWVLPLVPTEIFERYHLHKIQFEPQTSQNERNSRSYFYCHKHKFQVFITQTTNQNTVIF